MKVIKNFVLPFTALIIGIIIGRLMRDYPLITVSYNVKITEIISLLLTFGIGLFVPLLIKKVIDDKRSFKNSLIEEVNTFIKSTMRINERLDSIYSSAKITQKDKDGLTMLFEISDEEFESLFEFIKTHCKPNTSEELDRFKNKFIEYWKIVTGSEVTKSNVAKLDDTTYKRANKCYNELKGIARNIKAQLNGL